ncbi:hypothetical protein ALC60_06005 [Trachymyrmex zeteki]|uniref:Uncharacterized protein n=1 Tax=Mycetomoellerius zeteki TaxID=64791 RepID=A0A151X408_9HYME|nr:hypothetical protein ALC60_06005 [Trachymyrmex zeteki]
MARENGKKLGDWRNCQFSGSTYPANEEDRHRVNSHDVDKVGAHAANRPEQHALARDVLVVCVAPYSLAVTLAARTLRRERASVVLL